jgi:2-iminobutanoate/2-iminopropanoate deaminase
MDKNPIFTKSAPKPIGPYSQAMQAGGFVFVSGQIGMDPQTGELVAGMLEAETEQALDNLAAVLRAADSSLSDVVKTTIYLDDMNHFNAVNAVYNAYFSENKPARACIEVARLPKDARVEIEAVAISS